MKQQTFKLINGKFPPNDSREILQNIFYSKIQFHRIKNLSMQERFGKSDEMSLIRIPELKKSFQEILELIESAEKNGEQLEIKSEVSITFIPASENV